jgi:hypothetical protein
MTGNYPLLWEMTWGCELEPKKQWNHQENRKVLLLSGTWISRDQRIWFDNQTKQAPQNDTKRIPYKHILKTNNSRLGITARLLPYQQRKTSPLLNISHLNQFSRNVRTPMQTNDFPYFHILLGPWIWSWLRAPYAWPKRKAETFKASTSGVARCCHCLGVFLRGFTPLYTYHGLYINPLRGIYM